MHIFVETERLLLRELVPSDDAGMFELDSDPEVLRFLGNNPKTDIKEARADIEFVRKQYAENGIGRWAMLEKSTGAFLGWTGLKLYTYEVNGHTGFYDLGYRLIRKYWGRGFATESAIASVRYGFDVLKVQEIVGQAHVQNTASRNVLQKAGLGYVETFDLEGEATDWFTISK